MLAATILNAPLAASLAAKILNVPLAASLAATILNAALVGSIYFLWILAFLSFEKWRE